MIDLLHITPQSNEARALLIVVVLPRIRRDLVSNVLFFVQGLCADNKGHAADATLLAHLHAAGCSSIGVSMLQMARTLDEGVGKTGHRKQPRQLRGKRRCQVAGMPKSNDSAI